ncbi:MAG: four helix bundle protein [Anaerolineales bacterium]|nr:four helix bundle protein [Anaerolineales bacterium]MBP8164617.1 four helix bundle protein [Anaerolineales bacterium]
MRWIKGCAAEGKGQFGRYLDISQGSLAEVEYYLILAFDLNTSRNRNTMKRNPCVQK